MTPALPLVIVVGAGELGSAVCHRLKRSGLGVIAVDIDRPLCIRRRVCFAVALTEGSIEVEGVMGERAAGASEAESITRAGGIPVMAGDWRRLAGALGADVLVDATLRKRNSEHIRGCVPLTVGLGPGFEAGTTADVVIETNRGHDLGRVIYEGRAEPDTGVPGEILGISGDRVIRAPAAGIFSGGRAIGSLLETGDTLGVINGEVDVKAPIAGILRGLIADNTDVRERQKIGDIDPRGAAISVDTISDKGRAVAGGVLEAIMSWWVNSNA